MRLGHTTALLALLTLGAGCQPDIGDSCNNSLDCSATNQRICDTAASGGYCTLRGCDSDSCPGSALCVEWRGDEPRTADTWCMASCSNNGDCRQGAGYACVRDGDPELMDGDTELARVIDLGPRRDKGFCAYLSE